MTCTSVIAADSFSEDRRGIALLFARFIDQQLEFTNKLREMNKYHVTLVPPRPPTGRINKMLRIKTQSCDNIQTC